MKVVTWGASIALFFAIQGCFIMENPYKVIAPGSWRAVLQLDGKQQTRSKENQARVEDKVQIEEVSEGEAPFNFEVIYDSENTFHIEIINGSERIRVDDIQYGRNKTNGDDTIRINFPHYDSYITAVYEEKVMEGEWVVTTRNNYRIPFVAKQGQAHRFSLLKKKPALDLTGKWEATFGLDEEEPYAAVGEFQQKENHLTGTFLTETGDYRFLEGTIQADKAYLSCFDGSHAFLFEAKITGDSLLGSFRSGKHYKTIWKAAKNDNAKLADANSLTTMREGQQTLDFSFENADGKKISLHDEAYKNKVKLVQILGTWCPNCADETEFLADYMKKNPSKDLVVIGLSFEKHKEKEKAFQAIKRFQQRFGVSYDILWAGEASTKAASAALPMLNHVMSFPTMLYVDKQNKVRKIHTGFSGPATSEYPQFQREFEEFVQTLLNEKHN